MWRLHLFTPCCLCQSLLSLTTNTQRSIELCLQRSSYTNCWSHRAEAEEKCPSTLATHILPQAQAVIHSTISALLPPTFYQTRGIHKQSQAYKYTFTHHPFTLHDTSHTQPPPSLQRNMKLTVSSALLAGVALFSTMVSFDTSTQASNSNSSPCPINRRRVHAIQYLPPSSLSCSILPPLSYSPLSAPTALFKPTPSPWW